MPGQIESIESEVNIGFPNQDSEYILRSIRFIMSQE